MTKNEGSLDRIVRLALGIGLASWGVLSANWLGLFALIPLGTALVGWCPLYSLLGIRSCPLKKS